MNKYFDLVEKLLEELPFFNYIVRLVKFVRSPALDESDAVKNQLKHSLLDVVNSLGLVAVFVAFIVLLDQNFNFLNAITIINPFYVVFVCVYSALAISIFLALSFGILWMTNWARPNSRKSFAFYAIFSHGLRCYAAFGLFLGPMFVYSLGRVLTDGIRVESLFKDSEAWVIIISILLIWFPFRLIINPLYRFLNFESYKKLGYVATVLVVVASFKFNALVSPDIGDRLILNEKLCEVFKSGSFYEKLDTKMKLLAQDVMCKKSV